MLTAQEKNEENRRIQRIAMQLPLKVEVQIDKKKNWEEISRIKDVSVFGTGFVLSRPVRRGRLIHLTIPMPRRLRNYDFAEAQYHIWGIVRRCIKFHEPITNHERYSLGVGFIGKKPPELFYQNPATIFDITDRDEDGFWKIEEANLNPDETALPLEVRRHSRIKIPTGVKIEILDENGNIVASEMTVTENVSYSGAAIYTTLSPPIGSFIRVTSDQYNVTIISIIRGIRMGEDKIRRLHVEFIDRFFPLEGIV